MMNGAKKSDSLIIPAKPANKAGHPAAEPVEGSSGTERNAELQSTVRTQSREAVSQAQDRIRGAVTRNKKEKLTALLHHITVDVLRRVFFKLKKRAAPGVDGVTWEDYAADLDRNLTDLHARVHRGAYRASPPSRTRSSRQRWWRSSRRSTRRSSWGSATGSGPGVASMTRWMRSRMESRHAKSTGSSTPTYRASSIL